MPTLEDSIDTSIFDESETRIIIRGDVLTTEYIPKRLIGRDEQIKEVAGLMRQLFRHGFPNNGLIFGVSGSGKTVVSKFVLRSLMAKLEQNPIGINVDWIYIHCKKVYTQNSILYTLIKYLDQTTKVKKTGYSMDYYYDSLFHLMNTKNTALIVILMKLISLDLRTCFIILVGLLQMKNLRMGDLSELLVYLIVLNMKLDLTIELSLQWVLKK